VRKTIDAKHVVAEREIVRKSRIHFILFLSMGRNSR
jgi:hypothetical protein